MLALLFLVAVAAADPLLGDKKIITLYEDSLIPHTVLDTRAALRAMCLENCHHHVIDQPVTIVARTVDNKFKVTYSPMGLNHLSKSPVLAPVKELLGTKGMVAIIAPMAKFPFELFPGLIDSEVMIPEHHTKLSFMYKEAPIIAVLPEEEFKMFNEKRGYKPVADLAIDEVGFSLFKEYAQFNRNAISTRDAPGLYYLVPSATGADVMPSTAGLVPLTSSEYIRYLSAARPVAQPIHAGSPKTFFFK